MTAQSKVVKKEIIVQIHPPQAFCLKVDESTHFRKMPEQMPNKNRKNQRRESTTPIGSGPWLLFSSFSCTLWLTRLTPQASTQPRCPQYRRRRTVLSSASSKSVFPCFSTSQESVPHSLTPKKVTTEYLLEVDS